MSLGHLHQDGFLRGCLLCAVSVLALWGPLLECSLPELTSWPMREQTSVCACVQTRVRVQLDSSPDSGLVVSGPVCMRASPGSWMAFGVRGAGAHGGARSCSSALSAQVAGP